MKITGIKSFLAHPTYSKDPDIVIKKNMLLVKVETDEGIIGWGEANTMAEPYHVLIAPHNYNNSSMSLAASLQVCAVIPNFLILEYGVHFSELGDAIAMNPFKVENGYIRLPTTPGLGLEINEEALGNYSFKELPVREGY